MRSWTRLATQNEWEGLVIYGAVRQVDDLEELDIGIRAIIPPFRLAAPQVKAWGKRCARQFRRRDVLLRRSSPCRQHRDYLSDPLDIGDQKAP